ncbi:hypothetical protein Bpfe_031384 [Biomphalaria pfeifferi]|uniref:Uncharacterized protein n=1 Tax=Biomphalaria pfeifferi TaxID=112525 RepID=A0AAD8ETU5_BIOPF|nr:hypothetical protein Bpfe_031384 [Biomphalaria pfeifferi]
MLYEVANILHRSTNLIERRMQEINKRSSVLPEESSFFFPSMDAGTSEEEGESHSQKIYPLADEMLGELADCIVKNCSSISVEPETTYSRKGKTEIPKCQMDLLREVKNKKEGLKYTLEDDRALTDFCNFLLGTDEIKNLEGERKVKKLPSKRVYDVDDEAGPSTSKKAKEEFRPLRMKIIDALKAFRKKNKYELLSGLNPEEEAAGQIFGALSEKNGVSLLKYPLEDCRTLIQSVLENNLDAGKIVIDNSLLSSMSQDPISEKKALRNFKRLESRPGNLSLCNVFPDQGINSILHLYLIQRGPEGDTSHHDELILIAAKLALLVDRPVVVIKDSLLVLNDDGAPELALKKMRPNLQAEYKTSKEKRLPRHPVKEEMPFFVVSIEKGDITIERETSEEKIYHPKSRIDSDMLMEDSD